MTRVYRWLNPTKASGGACIVLAVIAATTVGCDRPIQIQPGVIEDAQLGVRIKTALVNDAQLGPRPIEVRVTRSVVTLSGLVTSTAEVARAIDLVRALPGVAEVRSELVVRAPSETVAGNAATRDPPAPTGAEREVSASRRRRFAIGASVNARRPANGLVSGTTVGPLFRLGTGRGLGLTLGFGWFDADLSTGASPEAQGRMTIRPVMGGASYTITDQARWAMSLSMVGGMAFNSFALEELVSREGLAVEVDNSLAVRPGVSLWFDLNSRAAFNVFAGYLVTRPQAIFLESGRFTRHPLRADTAVFNIGLAYKVF
ncbi:MAG: BON domain-containing protein [Acidobacteria bacterium]|nr:BON domain-containing protein [Acidobacteriota bacterium]